MAMDWGSADAFSGGDYPALGDVAAPSAPGKRAKRTFKKQQYTLDAMAAGTVALARPTGTLWKSMHAPRWFSAGPCTCPPSTARSEWS